MTVVIVTSLNKNNLTHWQHWQLMRYSKGSVLRFSRCFFFQLCSVSSAASPHLTPSSCPRALALWCLSPRKAPEAMAIFVNFWDRYVTIGWVKETVKIEGEGSVDRTLQRLTPPRNSYMYITCRMSRVMCSMINVKYIYMTQFEIECRFGGHSVTNKFKIIWQILLAKPK